MNQQYTVADMTCNHCKETIETALGGLQGVTATVVDVDAKTVTVTGDVASDVVEQAIRDAGYTPS